MAISLPCAKACPRRGCRRSEASLWAACGSGCDAPRLSTGRSIRAWRTMRTSNASRNAWPRVAAQLNSVASFRWRQKTDIWHANSGRPSASANHVGSCWASCLRTRRSWSPGRESDSSPKSQPRQCGLETLRMLVTGWPPNCGGPGMHRRAMTRSRSPSALLRTIGAS
jgi:hypothetical protein